MSAYTHNIHRLEEDVGELLEGHKGVRGLEEFTKYHNDPVGFIREVLHADPWSMQEEIAVAVCSHTKVVVRSSNAMGKDWLAARLALWWVYARRGYVLSTGPTERQVKNVVMGEVHRAFNRARDLPGQLYELALKLEGQDQMGILAFTSTGGASASKWTGFHAPKLMAIVTEAQGVEPVVWEGLFANLTGDNSRVLAVGNPLVASGKFFDFSRSRHWKGFKVSAFDHPNVIEGRNVIPGAITQRGIEQILQEYGEESSYYRSRVLAEFPDDAAEVLVRRSWLEEAARRHEAGDLLGETTNKPFVAALDVARFGADHTVLAIRKGPVLMSLQQLPQADTMVTCGHMATIVEQGGYFFQPDKRDGLPGRDDRLIVDEIGIGSGVLDRLRELKWRVVGFNAGGAARSSSTVKYLNRRAESYWGLRRLLELGQIALPKDQRLFDELAAMEWKVNSTGAIQIEAKDDFRSRVGRSPDRADAVAMCFDGVYRTMGSRWSVFRHGWW